MNKQSLQLTPKIDSRVASFAEKSGLVQDLVEACGSPLNIVFPEIFADNIRAFQKIFETNAILGRVYYAHKPNKSSAFVKQAAAEGIFIDVASEQELTNALGNGFHQSRILANGPKNTEFLILALLHKILVVVDNLDEVQQIDYLAKKLGVDTVTILIRLSGFPGSGSKESRFGIPIARVEDVLTMLAQNKQSIKLHGFSFHIDTARIEEKVCAVENLLQCIDQAKKKGFDPSIINIGGGFKVNYLEYKTEWDAYISALQKSVVGEHESLSWRNSGLGYRSEGGVIKGGPAFYQYFNEVSGADYLQQLLSCRLVNYDHQTIAQVLSDNLLHLYIEPGRALLNQAGITATKVNFVKNSAEGEVVVGLDMNRSNLDSANQEMMIDPIVLPRSSSQIAPGSVGVYFVGNLCLESDFIYKHKTFLNRIPKKGDILVFVNTAAYNMDFAESNTLQQRIAKKIAVIQQKEKFRWYLDEHFTPYKQAYDV